MERARCKSEALGPHKTVQIIDREADEELISLYASREKIYPRSVSGLFFNWRWGMAFLPQLVFYGFPWLPWGQRQAILVDLVKYSTDNVMKQHWIQTPTLRQVLRPRVLVYTCRWSRPHRVGWRCRRRCHLKPQCRVRPQFGLKLKPWTQPVG